MSITLPHRRRLRTAATGLAVVLLCAAVPIALNVADAATDFACSGGYQVDETLQNGARWQLCWERRDREGIVLHDVTYTPVGGSAVEILGQANLAQIHVPYHDNQARFHDLSDFGLGTDNFMDNLQAQDCPNGERLVDGAINVLCMTESPTGYAYKDYGQSAQATSLNLFSVSHIGAYNYIVAWNLDDDGTIRPEVGATGQLQAIVGGNTSSSGWPIGGNRIAVAHLHNYTWRLDFDVAGTTLNDRVEELEAPPILSATQRRVTRRLSPPRRPEGSTRGAPQLAGAGHGRAQRRQPPDLLRDPARNRTASSGGRPTSAGPRTTSTSPARSPVSASPATTPAGAAARAGPRTTSWPRSPTGRA